MPLVASVILGALLVALLAPAVQAAPPPNDAPVAPALFETYTADNGQPGELQGVAELAEATADPGVPACLGSGSFARTAWFFSPGTPYPRELTVEATGRTMDVVDLAAFVQPPGSTTPSTSLPNACAGAGVGGADASPDRVSAVSLRVPPYYPVLIQVGRRGPAGHPDDERALLTYSESALPPDPEPAGDRPGYGSRTPGIRLNRRAAVDLTGATTTYEEPAQPACPVLGGVWRRLSVRKKERLKITAGGPHLDALAAFSGKRPTPDNALDCVDREGRGELVLVVRARRKRPLWVRLGTFDAPFGSDARLTVERADSGDRPSAGGCLASLRPRISADRPRRLTLRSVNRADALVLGMRVRRGPLCAPALRLFGPRGRIYAAVELAALHSGRHAVRLPRMRRFRRGRYRLQLESAGVAQTRVLVSTGLSFRLTRRR